MKGFSRALIQIEEVTLAFLGERIYNLHLKGKKVLKQHLGA
jgi:23S rRNA maturation mini-RNase III